MNDNKIIMVSVCMITYNHEKYIRDAIEGVLMQQTNFQIELIIGEDFSTDDTRNICIQYFNAYPNFIKLILHENNIGMSLNSTATLQASKGKYIAICEGDDYWTDPLKLQKQVDFMEANQDCSICFHSTKRIRNNNPLNYSLNRPKMITNDFKYEMKHLIRKGGGFMDTCSMLFLKKYIEEQPVWMSESPVGDLSLMLVLASKGRIGYIDKVMSVYRLMSSATSWSAQMKNNSYRKLHFYGTIRTLTSFDLWTNFRYHKHIILRKWWITINYIRSIAINSVKNLTKRFIS